RRPARPSVRTNVLKSSTYPRTGSRVAHAAVRGSVGDFSTLVLTLGLAGLLVLGWRRLTRVTRMFVAYCLVLSFAAPALFNVIGHYAFYYAYLRAVPMI